MSSPDDIPKDVWDKSRLLFEYMVKSHAACWCNFCEKSMMDKFSKTILAERERCAVIANDFPENVWIDHYGTRPSENYDIAAAIRKGE